MPPRLIVGLHCHKDFGSKLHGGGKCNSMHSVAQYDDVNKVFVGERGQ